MHQAGGEEEEACKQAVQVLCIGTINYLANGRYVDASLPPPPTRPLALKMPLARPPTS